MTIKGKIYFAFILFGGMGIACLYLAIDIFITGTGPRGQDLLLNHYSNPILRYAIAFLAIGLFIPCLAWPILLYKGILASDYYHSPRHIKAKNNVIIATLLLPACAVLFAVFYNEGCGKGLHCKKIIFAGVLFACFYFYNIFILIRNKNKFSRNNSLERNS